MQKFTSEDYSAEQNIEDIEMECVNMGDIDTRHHQKHDRAVKNQAP